jgi:hypothetical protein
MLHRTRLAEHQHLSLGDCGSSRDCADDAQKRVADLERFRRASSVCDEIERRDAIPSETAS